MRTKYGLFYVFLAISLLGGNFACNEFLTEDPRGQMATVNYFKSKNDLDAAVTALYRRIAYWCDANNGIGTEALAGDDISTHPASNKASLREHDRYDVSENNAWLPTLWKSRYEAIKAANFIINNAPNTLNATEKEINQAIGIASFWRAYNYYYLVMTWGPVPVILTEEIDLEAQLTPVDKVFDFIIEDLKIAEANCPVNYTEAPYARNGINIAVSQGAVKAAMAYVYMSMAGWPMKKTEYYDAAAAKAKEVIDAANNGTYYYKLLGEFKQIHSMAYNDKNPETVVGVYYNKAIGQGTQSNITDFLQDMSQGGWGDTNGEIKFWKDFPDGPRKEASYFPKIILAGETTLRDWWENPSGGRFVVAPCFIKSVENNDGGEFDYTDPADLSSKSSKHHQVIRLAEVYCWYAEAVGRSGKINAQAVEVLNKVRNRADGKESNIYSMSMTPEQLAEAAYNEHGWEVAGYYWGGFATRARDMFRMYRYKDHFEFRKQNPLIEVAPGVFRKEAIEVTGTWDDKRMYAPYPYDDVVLNPNLKNK